MPYHSGIIQHFTTLKHCTNITARLQLSSFAKHTNWSHFTTSCTFRFLFWYLTARQRILQFQPQINPARPNANGVFSQHLALCTQALFDSRTRGGVLLQSPVNHTEIQVYFIFTNTVGIFNNVPVIWRLPPWQKGFLRQIQSSKLLSVKFTHCIRNSVPNVHLKTQRELCPALPKVLPCNIQSSATVDLPSRSLRPQNLNAWHPRWDRDAAEKGTAETLKARGRGSRSERGLSRISRKRFVRFLESVFRICEQGKHTAINATI